MGSGITLLTQIAHGLRSNGNMDFEDLGIPAFSGRLVGPQMVGEKVRESYTQNGLNSQVKDL